MTHNIQSLSLLRSSGSTGRVLNLALVFQRFGTTAEYGAKPLFRSGQLNRAILLKHTLRSHERSLMDTRNSTATKVVLPFDITELALGGYSFFINERGFKRNLLRLVGAKASETDLEADVEVLRLIDELPSLDPFLLRERLKRHGLEPARCYFDLAEADTIRMRAFVETEIRKLVSLAFAGDANLSGLSSRMADKLMTDETASSLEPLRMTLQLSGDDYREGVFAWKGFLYYGWLVADFATRLPTLSKELLKVRILRATSEERREIDETRRRIVGCLGLASGRVRDGIRSYKNAYEQLAAGKPTAFRDFLLEAPKLFLSVGEAISIIKHIDSYWSFRFNNTREMSMDIDDAKEVFSEFAAQLSGLEKKPATDAAAL